jgi:cell division protein FtsB
MNDGWKDKFVKWFALMLVAAVFVGGLLIAWPTFRRGQSLKRQDAELAQRIEEKRGEIAKLVENQTRFKTDPDFVEHIARQSRRVFPGELVFIFEDPK